MRGHLGVAHQNTFSFKHNKNSSTTRKILQIPNHGLCDRCHEKIEWRKKFRKYKPIRDARKCQSCHKKQVVFAYHVICQECCAEKHVCSKCLTPGPVHEPEPEEFDPSLLDGLKERERRTILRKLQNDAIDVQQLKRELIELQSDAADME